MKLLQSVSIFLTCAVAAFGQDTFSPITEGEPPRTFDDLWAGYDPRAEPLDVEVLKEWEEDGVVMQVLRYRVGIFKGQKAMIAAVYGFPKGAEGLPGLVQIHGGGQYADHRAVLTNAKRGYATISISWAGRISAPDYRVTPAEVKLLWERKTDDPNYRVTTDWGALDGYHAPSKNGQDAFVTIRDGSDDWTLDKVPSPRNNSWFLAALAARRALTFLEQQPEVDPDRLGVYGHSMGGKLTVLTAGSDDRVKAAAPSCGGMSDRYNDNPMFRATLGDNQYLERIDCPIVFLSPANDFHGRINDLQTALGEIQSKEWRVTCSPHHNHQDHGSAEVATQLWFDQHLKNEFEWPKTPGTNLTLETTNGVPVFTIRPDSSMSISSVDVYFTQDADPRAGHYDVINRFWHHAEADGSGGSWLAHLELASVDQPLWVYAHITYQLEKPVTGAGYYYGLYKTEQFTLSSPMTMVTAANLRSAGVRVNRIPSLEIESFDGDWEKEWFTYRPQEWGRRTHKVNDPLWKAPADAELSLKVQADEPNFLVVGIDGYAAEVDLTGGDSWQHVSLSPSDFRDARDDAMESFAGIMELRLIHQETLRERGPDATRKVGARWNGTAPKFRELSWIAGSSQ